jgi:hypothetical protein
MEKLTYSPILSFMRKPTKCTHMKLLHMFLLLATICFGHSCDHLQGVPQYEYQEYNRSHMKRIIEFSNVLSIIKVVYKIP